MKTEKRFVCTIDEEDGELVTLKMAPVDLVALLKLADELDTCSVDRLNHRGEPDRLPGREYARRIRDALGVER